MLFVKKESPSGVAGLSLLVCLSLFGPYPHQFGKTSGPSFVCEDFGVRNVHVVPQLCIYLPNKLFGLDFRILYNFSNLAALTFTSSPSCPTTARNFSSSVLMLSSPPSQQLLRRNSDDLIGSFTNCDIADNVCLLGFFR